MLIVLGEMRCSECRGTIENGVCVKCGHDDYDECCPTCTYKLSQLDDVTWCNTCLVEGIEWKTDHLTK